MAEHQTYWLQVVPALFNSDRQLAISALLDDPWTIELARDNAVLFFLLVNTVNVAGLDYQAVRTLVRLSRTDILRAVGCHPSASTERFFARMAYWELNNEAVIALRTLATKPLPPWARHCKNPHLVLMTRIGFCRWQLAAQVFDAIAQHDPLVGSSDMNAADEQLGVFGRPYVREVIDEIVEIMRLVDYGAARQDPAAAVDGTWRRIVARIERCRSLADLQLAHQYINDVLADTWGACPGKYLSKRAWPDAPLAGNADIEPIVSFPRLSWEGKKMRHCIATYAEHIFSGEGYVYRVLRPERATAYVVKDGNGAWRIAELRLSCNRMPGEATFAAVNQWLSSAGSILDMQATNA